MLSEITWKGRGRQNTYFLIWSKANEIGCKVVLSLFFLNLVPAGGPPSLPPAFIEREKRRNSISHLSNFLSSSNPLFSPISPKYFNIRNIDIQIQSALWVLLLNTTYNTRSLVLFDLKCFLREISFPFQYCVQSRILVFVGWNDVILIFLWSLFSKSIEIFRKYERSGRFA